MATKKSPSARKVPAAAKPQAANAANAATATKAAAASKAGADRRAELRAQQEAAAKKARRNRLLMIIAIVVAVALVLGLIIWGIGKAGKASSGPTGNQITPPDGNSTDISQAAWINVPGTSPLKSTALRVDIHFDYQCPYCKMTEDAYAKLLESLANSGDIDLNLHNRIFLDGNFPGLNSQRAAMAAACVDYADDTKFYAYNNIIFANQPATEGGGFTDKQLTADFPASIGLTGDALAKFNTCYSGRQTQDWVTNVEKNNVGTVNNNAGPPTYLYGSDSKLYQDSSGNIYPDDPSKGTEVGVNATPTIFVNGKIFAWNSLFTAGSTSTSNPVPTITDAATLLAALQQGTS